MCNVVYFDSHRVARGATGYRDYRYVVDPQHVGKNFYLASRVYKPTLNKVSCILYLLYLEAPHFKVSTWWTKLC